jgi:CelD/BcsL family acetyltransferase involved in cellulose biosynthesis
MDAAAVAQPRNAGRALVIERVRTREALDALRPEWEALWSSVQDRTPFQHPAWLLPWWDVFGRGALRVLLLREDGILTGLAPLYISPDCELRLLGAGVSDYLDALAAPGAERNLAAAVSIELESSRADWSFCGFDNLRERSPLLHVDAPSDAAANTASTDPCPFVRLPDRIDELADRIAPKLASHLRYSRRRAERLGGLTIEQASDEELQEALTALFALHGTRWAEKGQAGVLSDAHVRRFHRRAAAALQAAGLLRLSVLRIGTRVAAVHYGLRAGDRAFFYLGGFDPEFGALSVGSLAIAAAMERAIEGGASTFDFLAGREPYKYRWGAVDRPRSCRHLTRADSVPPAR